MDIFRLYNTWKQNNTKLSDFGHPCNYVIEYFIRFCVHQNICMQVHHASSSEDVSKKYLGLLMSSIQGGAYILKFLKKGDLYILGAYSSDGTTISVKKLFLTL